MSGMKIIELEGLIKDYGAFRALTDVSWSLEKGELLGFLGPNGAGKTTAIRIMLGYLRATDGQARVYGLDAWAKSTEIRSRIGYLPGDVRHYTHMKGRQVVAFFAAARGPGGGIDAQRLTHVFGLDLNRKVRTYSKGMRQQLGLILALMHRPELLILDEPSSGLDPLMQQTLYAELQAAVKDGRSVLFSSHSLPEVENLCARVVILRKGRVVANQSIADLRKHAGHRVSLLFDHPIDTLPNPPQGLTLDRINGTQITARWQGDPGTLTQWLSTLPLADVNIEPPDLEDLFIDYYSDRKDPS
jgi:ABC-2 type transport system ATP-binding protein